MESVVVEVDCVILCGHRGKEEQDRAVQRGKSKAPWPTSRHNTLPSEAVDVGPFPLSWDTSDPAVAETWARLATTIRAHAKRLDIDVEWGGDWKMRDLPHWQIRRPAA
jgi:hypothetical protein